jgi:hypothetical protein
MSLMEFHWQKWDEAQRIKLEQDLQMLSREVEAIKPLYVLQAYNQLVHYDNELKRIETQVALFSSTLTAQAFALPLSKPAKPEDLLEALGSMNQGLLSVLHIRQQAQAVSSRVERDWALLIAWLSIYLALGLGFVSLILGLYPIWNDWHKKEDHPAENVVTKNVDALPRLAVFPVRFPSNATGKAGNWSGGILPSETEKGSLAFLMRSLHGCGDPTEPNLIRLNVVGFASSAEFKGHTPEQSSALNLEVANRRASEVASILQRLRDDEGLTAQVAIETRLWPTFEAMAAHRPFNDRPNATPDERGQEIFNRVVEVEMVTAGRCEAVSSK